MLTAFTGRFSQSKKTYYLFIGDNKGTLKVFNTNDYITENEYEMFPDRPDGKKRAKAIE